MFELIAVRHRTVPCLMPSIIEAIADQEHSKGQKIAKVIVSTGIGAIEGTLIAAIPTHSMLISAGMSAVDSVCSGLIESIGEPKVDVGGLLTDAVVSAGFGAVAGAGASDFVKGGKLINEAASSFGNAFRKGVNPVVKKAARKVVKKAAKYVGRKYLSGQLESVAYSCLSDFSSWYIFESVDAVRRDKI